MDAVADSVKTELKQSRCHTEQGYLSLTLSTLNAGYFMMSTSAVLLPEFSVKLNSSTSEAQAKWVMVLAPTLKLSVLSHLPSSEMLLSLAHWPGMT